MRVVGFDPGMKGGMALLVDGELVEVYALPVHGNETSAAGVASKLRSWLPSNTGSYQVSCIALEDVHAMPKSMSDTRSAFRLGESKGVILGVAGTLSHPLVRLTPQRWKKLVGIPTGSDKAASNKMATDRWPQFADEFKRRDADNGKADAALIALAATLDERNLIS